MASAVTYEMVEHICNELTLAGESPTYLKIHERLGKGSTRIVSAHLRQWRESAEQNATLGRDPLFGEWPEALQLKARSLFDALLLLSSEAASVSAEAQREAFEVKEQALKSAALEARQALDDALGELQGERTENARLRAELQSLGETVETQQDRIVDLLEQRATHTAQLAERERRSEALHEEHVRQIAALGGRAEAERERWRVEVREQQERAAGEREHLMRQTDQLRQDHASSAQELRQRLAHLEAALASQRRKTGEAESQATELTSAKRQLDLAVLEAGSRITALQDEIVHFRTQALESATRLSSQETRIGMLEQQLRIEMERTRSAEERLEVVLMRAPSSAPPPAALDGASGSK